MNIRLMVTGLLGVLAVNGTAVGDGTNIDSDFGLVPTASTTMTPTDAGTIQYREEEGTEIIRRPDGSPILVRLQPGVERRLVFPAPVMVGLQNGVADRIQIQNVDRTVFMVASGDIEHTRVLVRHLDDSATYVLNVTTEGFSARHTALVINPDTISAPATAKVPKPTPRLRMKKRRDQTVYSHYVRLTRFAAQQLYGPTRIINGDTDLKQVDDLDTVTPVAIVRGDRVTGTPIASWSDGEYRVTAIRLTNRTPDSVNLDPRDLRGRWLAATFHANSLGGQGQAGDTTAVYVVSHDSFDNALGVVR